MSIDTDGWETQKDVFHAALQLYYGPSLIERGTMATFLIDALHERGTMTSFDDAVISTLFYFKCNNFIIGITENEIETKTESVIPETWRNTICNTRNGDGVEVGHSAVYYMRLNTQEFTISIHYLYAMKSVDITVFHVGKNSPYPVSIPIDRFEGYANAQLRVCFAKNVLDTLDKGYGKKIVKNASLNKAPSGGSSSGNSAIAPEICVIAPTAKKEIPVVAPLALGKDTRNCASK